MSSELIVTDNAPIEVHARGESALAQLEPEITALAPEELSNMNVDPALTASRVLGAVPAIRELRPRIVRECPTADIAAIDQIEDRAYALLAVNAEYDSAITTPQGFASVTNEGFEARPVLLSIVQTFINCNMLKPEQIAKYKGGRGYHELSDDILLLTGVIKRGWVSFENKAPITLAQVERLQGIGEEIARLNGVRDAQPQRVSRVAEKRVRVFTLVDRAYDEVRRVFSYLRWREGDADSLVPALRGRNAGRPKADETKDANANATAKPDDAPSATGTPKVPVVDTMVMEPVTTTPADKASPPAVPLEAKTAPSGLPRSDPYGRRE